MTHTDWGVPPSLICHPLSLQLFQARQSHQATE